MSILLRIAAIYSLAWAIALSVPASLPGGGAAGADAHAVALALAVANLAYAVLFWTAAGAPAAHRIILYTALAVFGLRAAIGTYLVLYSLDGLPAVLQLIDMVLSVAAFVGIVNLLPGALATGGDGQE